jgi:hypothetical protein
VLPTEESLATGDVIVRSVLASGSADRQHTYENQLPSGSGHPHRATHEDHRRCYADVVRSALFTRESACCTEFAAAARPRRRVASSAARR